MSKNNVRPLQLAVLQILDNATEAIHRATPDSIVPIGDWSVQGFGMLRLYIRGLGRLRIWDSQLQYPGVSLTHNHSWDLRSTVVSGAIINDRFVELSPFVQEITSAGTPYKKQRILTGYDCKFVAPIEDTFLRHVSREVLKAGSVYDQKAKEVHVTHAMESTITLMERNEDQNGEADLYWPATSTWGTAKPRPATIAEIMLVVNRAKSLLLDQIDGAKLVEVTCHGDRVPKFVIGHSPAAQQ